MTKTKAVGGKEYPASAFAYVGDPEDIATWHLLIEDAGHVRDAMSRFNQTEGIPADKKAAVARKILARAKHFGIDGANFAKEYVTKQAMSLEQRSQAVSAAVMNKFGRHASGAPKHSVVSTFNDYVISQDQDGNLNKIPYDVAGDEDDVTIGDPQRVDVAYVPVRQSASFVSEAAGGDPWTYPVQVMKPGRAHGTVDGANGLPHYFTPEVVKEVAQALSGAKFGKRHPAGSEIGNDPERIAGWFENGRVTREGAAHADLHLFKSENDLQAKLSAAREAKKLNLFGLSILGSVGFRKGAGPDGAPALISTRLGKLYSVDLVSEAGAGGEFLQVAASASMLNEISALQSAEQVSPGALNAAAEKNGAADASRKNGGAMKEKILKVLEALRKKNAGCAAELEREVASLKEDQHADFLMKVTEAAVAEAEKHAAANTADADEVKKLVKEAKDSLAEAQRLRSHNLLDEQLRDSKLPAPAQKLVREHLKEGELTKEKIEGEIKLVRESFAAMETTGRVRGGGVVIGMDSKDKVQAAMDAMLGVKEALGNKDVKAFRSLKEAYVTITGDSEFTFGESGRGGFLRVAEATALTSTFPNILLDALNKRLLQDYADPGWGGLQQLISEVDIADFKPQHRIRMGYLGNLATVSEDAAYVDFALPTDEQVTYSAVTYGNLFEISRRTILNDDLNKLRDIPSRGGRAAMRTLKQFILNFFINNPNYGPDSVAWFNAAHSNLGSTPLTVDNLIAADILLGQQTEKDSGAPLDLQLQWLMVPRALAAAAWKINNAETYNPGPNIFVPNPFYQRFGQNNERIIVSALFDATDTDDWYYGALPSEAPILEIGYVQGQRTPQIFLQNDPTVGNVFTNDRITYKVRHEYGGAILDFRGVGKNVV